MRAKWPSIAHLSKQAKGQTHHLNITDRLKLSKYERLVKGQRMILTSNAKTVPVLTYLTVFINICTKSLNKNHELFPCKSPESKFDLAIKTKGQPKVIIRTCFFGKNLQNFP